MDLNIFPSKVGEKVQLEAIFQNEIGEQFIAHTHFFVSAPNLRSSENNENHLFFITKDKKMLCSHETEG